MNDLISKLKSGAELTPEEQKQAFDLLTADLQKMRGENPKEYLRLLKLLNASLSGLAEAI